MSDLTPERIAECIACWKFNQPVPDFDYPEALALARAARERDSLRAKLDALVAALARIHGLGHNNDCIFCGFKDREAQAAIRAAKEAP